MRTTNLLISEFIPTRHRFRVKMKSLAEESRIIRRETSKAKVKRDKANKRAKLEPAIAYGEAILSLHNHRVTILREEQRATYLAFAYLLGRPYAVVEKAKNKPTALAVRICDICRSLSRHALRPSVEQIRQWMNV